MDEPAATPDANPEAEMVATVAFDEVHVTEFVKFWVLVSENVPVAVNCCVAPAEIDGLAGVTAIEVRVAAVTFKVVDPVTALDVA